MVPRYYDSYPSKTVSLSERCQGAGESVSVIDSSQSFWRLVGRLNLNCIYRQYRSLALAAGRFVYAGGWTITLSSSSTTAYGHNCRAALSNSLFKLLSSLPRLVSHSETVESYAFGLKCCQAGRLVCN
eukprot:g38847.t1